MIASILVAISLAVAIGLTVIRLVANAARASRNLDWLESSDDAALEKPEGDQARENRGDARWCAEARVSVELDGTFI